ncbi:MAG: TolC family protein [Terracidiphilus sp.]|jgi:cobalt-zinc-cadmium efflux system outer membrane protein
MKQFFRFMSAPAVAALLVLAPAMVPAQQSLTWDQVKAKFEAANPALKADALGVDEMKAAEITAFLRPNPQVGLSSDGLQLAPHTVPGLGTHWLPLTGDQLVPSINYLHEREHKRELRLQSAKEGTQIAGSEHEDLERNLLFDLRSAFVQTLQAKAVLELAKADLAYYDKIIQISRDRFRAGDLAQIDLDRIELLRVQYETEIQAAIVNLRTSKIQLLQLLNERTPVEQFDVTGPFDFSDTLKPLEDFRQIALDERPDLRAALEAVQQANTNHKLAIANGSADPTLSTWYSYNPAFNNNFGRYTLGASVNVPLRIFDRNQGEKQRTQIDIGRNQQLTEATRAQVFSDVDSAYTQVESSVALLRPYKAQYKDQALRVRDTVTYSYQHGGASLMDFLNAQSDYRAVELAYVQLIGSYLTAAGQLNLAVGREVIQ